MRILFDTNVILDAMMLREPHVEAAARLIVLVDRKKIEGLLCATTVTTIYYMTAKERGKRKAHESVRNLLGIFEIAMVDKAVLVDALDMNFSDYEDAVLCKAASNARANGIVTRDRRHFTGSSIRVYSPANLLTALDSPNKSDSES